jgi:hypothetical protein
MKEQETTSSSYPPIMSRRSFIAASIVLGAAGGISLIAGKGHAVNFGHNTNQLLEKLLSAMRDRQSAVQVGKVILNEREDAFQLPNLVASVMNNLGLSVDMLSSIKRADLITRLNNRTVLDFDSGAVIDTAGWILGQTEAQLCALAAKAQSSSLFSTGS